MMVYLLQPMFNPSKKKEPKGKIYPLRIQPTSIGIFVFDEISMDYIEFYKEFNGVISE